MQNVGTIEAIVRITGGALLLTWASRQPKWGLGTSLVAAFGAAKVAEGVVRYCPLNSILKVSSIEDEEGKVVFGIGPLKYRRIGRLPARTLWGVRPETERDELGYRAPTAVETSGWNWEGQQNND